MRTVVRRPLIAALLIRERERVVGHWRTALQLRRRVDRLAALLRDWVP